MSWGCPHESNGVCLKVKALPCDPGMKGCVLYGRVTFSKEEKNSPSVRRRQEESNDETKR